MIGHDAAIQGLNSLSKAGVRSVSPSEHVEHLSGESERMHMILLGSTIDDILADYIKASLPGPLNSDDRSNLYGFDGPLGTFGSRTLFALAMGIIDRDARKQIDIMRSIRNAAAHATQKIDYSTTAVRNALRCTVRNDRQQSAMAKWDNLAFRKFHGVLATALCRIITLEQEARVNVAVLFQAAEEDFRERRRASPETQREG